MPEDERKLTPAEESWFKAIKKPDLKEAERLYTLNGINVNQTDVDGYTPLIWAAEKGYAEVVTVLLEWGATVDQEDKDSFTPLHYAAAKGHAEVVKILLAHKAKLSQPSKERRAIPLHEAAAKGKLEVVKLLLENKSEAAETINRLDKSNSTPLRYAAANGHAEILTFLLANGAQEAIDRADNSDFTPLHYAAKAGHLEAVRVLLAHRANVNQADYSGKTPLYMAIEGVSWSERALVGGSDNAKLEIVKMLLAAGAAESVNRELKYGDLSCSTPLRLALWRCFLLGTPKSTEDPHVKVLFALLEVEGIDLAWLCEDKELALLQSAVRDLNTLKAKPEFKNRAEVSLFQVIAALYRDGQGRIRREKTRPSPQFYLELARLLRESKDKELANEHKIVAYLRKALEGGLDLRAEEYCLLAGLCTNSNEKLTYYLRALSHESEEKTEDINFLIISLLASEPYDFYEIPIDLISTLVEKNVFSTSEKVGENNGKIDDILIQNLFKIAEVFIEKGLYYYSKDFDRYYDREGCHYHDENLYQCLAILSGFLKLPDAKKAFDREFLLARQKNTRSHLPEIKEEAPDLDAVQGLDQDEKETELKVEGIFQRASLLVLLGKVKKEAKEKWPIFQEAFDNLLDLEAARIQKTINDKCIEDARARLELLKERSSKLLSKAQEEAEAEPKPEAKEPIKYANLPLKEASEAAQKELEADIAAYEKEAVTLAESRVAGILLKMLKREKDSAQANAEALLSQLKRELLAAFLLAALVTAALVFAGAFITAIFMGVEMAFLGSASLAFLGGGSVLAGGFVLFGVGLVGGVIVAVAIREINKDIVSLGKRDKEPFLQSTAVRSDVVVGNEKQPLNTARNLSGFSNNDRRLSIK